MKKSLKVLVYLVFLAAVAEGMTRLALAIPRFADRLPTTEEDWWRNSWIQRHRSSGKEIYYDFDIYDPTKGWISKPNLTERAVFDHKVLNTNSTGLRGKTEFSVGKHPGKRRMLVLGDSFTFGDEVSDDETYCHYLQELLPEVEVINLGMHGYGHDQMLILLEEQGMRYEPDIVLLGFVALDMPRNVLAFRDYAKPKFRLKHDTLELTGTPVPRPEETIARDWKRLRALELLRVAWERFRKSSGRYDRDVQATTTAILDEMVALTRGHGATPVFVYLPTGSEITAVGSIPGEEYLFSVCRSNDQVACFSTRPALTRAAVNGVKFKSSGHWGPEGHRAAAEAIEEYLVDQGLVAEP